MCLLVYGIFLVFADPVNSERICGVIYDTKTWLDFGLGGFARCYVKHVHVEHALYRGSGRKSLWTLRDVRPEFQVGSGRFHMGNMAKGGLKVKRGHAALIRA
jgi:hypothetical protein